MHNHACASCSSDIGMPCIFLQHFPPFHQETLFVPMLLTLRLFALRCILATVALCVIDVYSWFSMRLGFFTLSRPGLVVRLEHGTLSPKSHKNRAKTLFRLRDVVRNVTRCPVVATRCVWFMFDFRLVFGEL